MTDTRNKRTVANSFYALGVLALVLALAGCGSSEADETNRGAADDHGEEERLVAVAASVLEEFDIEISTAEAGTLMVEATFPGEIRVNEDRYAQIVPRVSGVVHSAMKSVGDPVRAGDILAVLDSRELADVKSSYLARLERVELRRITFQREEQLYEQKISSQQEFFEARQELTEAQIALRSDRQKLLALGVSESAIDDLSNEPEHELVHYELVAPFDGVVVERYLSEGEAIAAHANAFAVADLETVWVDLSVFQKDLDLVEEGQDVRLTSSGRHRAVNARIDYVQPIVGEETRTAIARIILNNEDGRWRPGVFVTGTVSVDGIIAPLVVAKSALIQLDGETVVFVESSDGFRPQPVMVGQENGSHAAVISGLDAGARYVSRGGFALKAELEKGEVGDGHGH